jgi:hypothetical protein
MLRLQYSPKQQPTPISPSTLNKQPITRIAVSNLPSFTTMEDTLRLDSNFGTFLIRDIRLMIYDYMEDPLLLLNYEAYMGYALSCKSAYEEIRQVAHRCAQNLPVWSNPSPCIRLALASTSHQFSLLQHGHKCCLLKSRCRFLWCTSWHRKQCSNQPLPTSS